MTGFRVDPDGLTASGQGLEDVATRLVEALSSFQSELDGFGQPWGSDDIGSLIGAAHDAVREFAFECYQTALEEIGTAGVDLSGMGEQYRAVETAITDSLTTLNQGLEA